MSIENFKGFPYPISKNPRGYWASQNGVDQIKSDMLILLLTYPGERCLTGDTEISLANGTEVPIKDLVGKEPFWVYSYDENLNAIVPGKATAYKTLENAELIEVILDNKQKVRCTSNHLWLLRDGTYRRTDELCIGDSLMPLYRNFNTSGYERIKNNNSPDNLQWMAYQGHKNLHKEISNAYQKQKLKNHKVIAIAKLEYREDCYDLHVEKYHNFALSAGVFVHNCMLPTFGTPLKDLIFDPNDKAIEIRARDMIANSITLWEPRISVDAISVSAIADISILSPMDNLTETGAILTIKIQFKNPQNVSQSENLVLAIPLPGS